MKKPRRLYALGAVFLSALLLFSFSLPAVSAAERPQDTTVQAVLLYCFNTDTVLYQKAADKPLAPAATAKLMTALLLLERYQDLSASFTLTANHLGAAQYDDTYIGFTEGARFTVEDLLATLLIGIPSFSNRAATLLAIETEGSLDAFVAAMNTRAASLGMTQTLYRNPAGQDAEGAHTTAADVALLARTLYADSRFRALVDRQTYTLSTGYTLHTYNALMGRYYQLDKYLYAPATGMIAGSSSAGGNVLVATSEEANGYSYLCVLLGATEENGSNTAYTVGASLLSWGGKAFAMRRVLLDATLITTLPVTDADGVTQMPIYAQTSISRYLPKALPDDAFTYEYTLSVDSLTAPCPKNTVVGEITVYQDGVAIATCPLVTGADVTRSASADFKDAVVGALTSIPAILLYLFCALLLLRKILIAILRQRRRQAAQAELAREESEENTPS